MAMIYCSSCGIQIEDTASYCPNCGKPIVQVPSQAPMPPCPESPLAKAIVMTILLCPAFGIPAIVNAAGVFSAYAAGNYDLAVEKARKANMWCRYTVIFGIIWWIQWILIYAIYLYYLIEYGIFDI